MFTVNKCHIAELYDEGIFFLNVQDSFQVEVCCVSMHQSFSHLFFLQVIFTVEMMVYDTRWYVSHMGLMRQVKSFHCWTDKSQRSY